MSGNGTDGIGGGPGRQVDAGRLWIGGAMAGLVGAGIVVVGFLLVRGILDIPVLIERGGRLVDADVWLYALGTFAAALVATGLLHGLLARAPRPYTFFGWITGLGIVIAALVPFTTGAELASRVALSAINIVAGTVMATIISTVGRGVLRLGGPVDPYRQQARPADEYPDAPGRW
jgi:hypothetical protein